MCMDVRRVRSSPVACVLSMMQRVWHGKDVWVTWEIDSWQTLLGMSYRRGRGDKRHSIWCACGRRCCWEWYWHSEARCASDPLTYGWLRCSMEATAVDVEAPDYLRS